MCYVSCCAYALTKSVSTTRAVCYVSCCADALTKSVSTTRAVCYVSCCADALLSPPPVPVNDCDTWVCGFLELGFTSVCPYLHTTIALALLKWKELSCLRQYWFLSGTKLHCGECAFVDVKKCVPVVTIIIIIIIIISSSSSSSSSSSICVLTKLKETPHVETTSIQLSVCPYKPCFEFLWNSVISEFHENFRSERHLYLRTLINFCLPSVFPERFGRNFVTGFAHVMSLKDCKLSES